MDIVAVIAEGRIREAQERGEFDNLSLKGQPLKLNDMSRIPEELRAGYIILKNAGILPEELEIKKEIISLHKLVECCHEEGEKYSLRKKLNQKILRFEMMMEKRKVHTAGYKDKIYKRFGAY